MKITKRISVAAIVLLLFISSCSVLSFHPLYTEDVLIKNDHIIGKWQTIEEKGLFHEKEYDTLVWEIQFDDKKWVKKPNKPFDRGTKEEPNSFTYSLVLYYLSQPDLKTEFQLHLVNLEGKPYIDFFPESWEANNTILDFHLIGVHTFAKIDIKTDSITINWFDSEWFEEKLEKEHIRIKHEKNSSNILLTAQPKELQKFVIKYSDDENAFEKDFQFVLKPHKR